MARDTSRRGTPRGRTLPAQGRAQSRPRQAARPAARPTGRPAARPAARPRRAPKAKVATGRPAFLDNAAAVRRGAPQGGKERRERYQRGQSAKAVVGVVGGVAALAVVLVVAYFVLRSSSAFAIQNVVCEPTEHVTESDIKNLLEVPDGATLLNFDGSVIEASLKKDPWVGSVSFERQFPDTLRVVVNEQSTDALVVMNAGSIAWYLGTSGSWIQPTKVTVAQNQSVNDAALAQATSEGVLLITDVPSSVSPKSGSEATDDVFAAVRTFRDGFSADFSAQVVSYSAPSADNISCTLASGVEISLGSATQVSSKEAIAKEILAAHPGKVTFINVRVPSSTGSSYRSIDSEDVEAGTGVTSGSASDVQSSDAATPGTDTASGGQAQ
ncbi:cell division protein FtsQ/DivIB [Paratractidigestivibacter faecalis]|uniref:cell division protein FtsQ/DivIB n=1 Tax=Paratractidigestivibacter faecalis TaxID=2292441 RepID=UPI003A916648